jgi:hypothetical protein
MNRVHIEFQRVQTWLFAVPRLRAMVGANALLGETLRIALPGLARETGHWTLEPSTETYPSAHPNDPLRVHDDPAADARDGILARDGGHFEAQFASGAEGFADAARQLLRAHLPGLRFRITIDGVERQRSQTQFPTELPVLAPCEWTGRGLASDIVKQGSPHDEDHEEFHVSLDVKQRHGAALRAEKWKAFDVATVLSATTKLKDLDRERVKELKDLVGSGYLALIHADGNAVGEMARSLSYAERAQFFHRNRVLLRRAVQAAIDAVCADDVARKGESQAPFILLMLGGDDLLLVCRARVALPFVVRLCQTLDDLQSDETATSKLTLGIGVVLARRAIPIHRTHEVAAQLAGSAKRRFRGLKETGRQGRSVVDWAVYTTTWVDEPQEVRRRDWVRGSGNEVRVLSQRPVDVLGHGLDSLQGLVHAAEQVALAPRSQFRYLVDQLPRGRMLSELAFVELSSEAKSALDEARLKSLWRRPANNGPWLTPLLDLVEIAEIARLGRSAERTDGERTGAHA